MKCKGCGGTLELTMSACPACGAEVELGRLTGILGIVCRACDAYNEPGAKACAACGKPFGGEPAPPPVPAADAPAPARSSPSSVPAAARPTPSAPPAEGGPVVRAFPRAGAGSATRFVPPAARAPGSTQKRWRSNG